MSIDFYDIEIGDILKQEYKYGNTFYYLVVDVDIVSGSDPLCKLQQFGESESHWDAIYNADHMMWSVVNR